MRRVFFGMVSLSLFLGMAGPSDAGGYTYISIDVPGTTRGTAATGINDDGQVVGYVYGQLGVHGYLLSGGQFTTVDAPGATDTYLNGINDAGQIVGTYSPGTGVRGFLLSGGVYTDLDPPGATDGSNANGINTSGQIVGIGITSGLQAEGFLLGGGDYTTLNPPGSINSSAFGINASGDVVGSTFIGSQYQGFLLSGGVYTTFNVPGSDFTGPSGINDAGQIVGTYDDHGHEYGFLLSGGVFTTLEVPGSMDTLVNGINDAGDIVGAYIAADGGEHGFVGIYGAVPEPGSLTLMVFGAGFLGRAFRGRRPRDSRVRSVDAAIGRVDMNPVSP